MRNTSAGVEFQVEGEVCQIEVFVSPLRTAPTLLASIDQFEQEGCLTEGLSAFELLPSEARQGEFIPVSPAVNLCGDWRRERYDPADRRCR